MSGVLVYFRGGPWNGRVQKMPDDRPTWALPDTPAQHGAFYFGASLGPLPQPSIYTRSTREYERVLTRDLIVKKGTRLQDFDVSWESAMIYDCVSDGGR